MTDRFRRKTRTREHVIADPGFHHLAMLIVRAGYIVDVPRADYGYDLTIGTFDDAGEYENGAIFVQLKATEHLNVLADGRISFAIERRDVALWEDEPFPVYLVVFDAVQEQAFALDLQMYLGEAGITAATLTTAAVTVHLDPLAVTDETVRDWRRRKNEVVAQLRTVR